jgi:hypothetical protein
MFERILNNPARIVAAVAAILVALQAFGANVTDAQQAAILTVAETVLAVIGLMFAGEAVRANIKGPVTVKNEEAANDNGKRAAA